MTTSADLINRALDHAIDKDPATLKLIIDLVVEYKIAVNQANKIERTLHAMIKDREAEREKLTRSDSFPSEWNCQRVTE